MTQHEKYTAGPDTPAPEFTPAELEAMNSYCLKFRALMRGGGTPTKAQEERFMAFSGICYSLGAAHE